MHACGYRGTRVGDARLTVAIPPDTGVGEAQRDRGREVHVAPSRSLLLGAAVAASIFWISFDHGSFDIAGRFSITVAVWWLLAGAVALDLWPVERTPAEAVVAAAGLAGLALLTAASIGWGATTENALTELNRVLLYLGVFLVAALGGSRRNVGRLCDGAALGVAAVAVLALSTRLYPHVIDTSETLRFLSYGRTRLNYPVGYWNGLSILLALTIPLLLRLATVSRLTIRALAVSTLPMFGAVMYLTGSRTGVFSALTAIVVFLVLTPRRLAASAVLLLSGTATAGVLAVLASRDALVDGPLGTAIAEEQGRAAAPRIFALCVGAGLLWTAGTLLARRLPKPGALAERVPLAVVVVALVAGIAVSEPVTRIADFKRLPAEVGNQGIETSSRLGSTSGNGRWQMWAAAAEQFRAHPLAGGGAGTFQSWWERHRSLPLFVRDAHSLYMEMLGELGILGVAFLATALGAGGVAIGRRAGRGEEGQRIVFAAVGAVFLAFAVAAAADWMWEFTVVSVAGIAALGLVTGQATAVSPSLPTLRQPRLARALLALGATLVVIVLAMTPLVGEIMVRESQAAARRGDLEAALENALAARSIEPWATTPYLQIALVHESAGHFNPARSSILEAIERDRSNWSLWLVKARIETRAGKVKAARRSLARARALNPLSFAGSAGAG